MARFSENSPVVFLGVRCDGLLRAWEGVAGGLDARAYVFLSAGPDDYLGNVLLAIFPGLNLEECKEAVTLPTGEGVLYAECTYFRHLTCWFEKKASDPLRLRPVVTTGGFTKEDVDSRKGAVWSVADVRKFFRSLEEEDRTRGKPAQKRARRE